MDPGVCCACERRAGVLHADDRAHQVQIDGGADRGDVGVEDRTEVQRSPGAGEEPVDAAGGPGGGLDRGRDLLFDRDIGHRVRDRGPTGGHRRDALDGVGELLLGAAADGHMGAVARQPLGRGQPDAAAAARDQDRPALDAARGGH